MATEQTDAQSGVTYIKMATTPKCVRMNPESVDLLQMIPQSSAHSHSPQDIIHRSPQHNLQGRSQDNLTHNEHFHLHDLPKDNPLNDRARDNLTHGSKNNLNLKSQEYILSSDCPDFLSSPKTCPRSPEYLSCPKIHSAGSSPHKTVSSQRTLSPHRTVTPLPGGLGGVHSVDGVRGRRQSRGGLQGNTEEDVSNESDSGIHTCHDCRNCGIYYERRDAGSPGANEEGSIYFNYIQFAQNAQRTSRSGPPYEPVYPSPARQKLRPSVFACCQTHSSPSRCNSAGTASTTYQFPTSCREDESEAAHVGSSDRLHHRSSTRGRRQVHRLLALAAILVGILTALAGLVVSFVVLAPFDEDPEPLCISGYIPCGDNGCVNVRHFCAGLVDNCPDVSLQHVCHQNGSSVSTPEGSTVKYTVQLPVTLPPTAHEPSTASETEGWVYYPGGSTNGSKYTIINSAMTFYGGQEECRQRGGYLVHVNTIREQVFLMDYLSNQLLHTDISQDGVGFWLGARRSRGSHSGTCMYDQWKWVDPYGRQHGVISGFTAFVPGKPDNYFSPEECLYLTYNYPLDDDSNLRWDDAPCDIHSVGGIKVLCEVEIR